MSKSDAIARLIKQFQQQQEARRQAAARMPRAHAEQMEPRVMLSVAKAIETGSPELVAGSGRAIDLHTSKTARPLVIVDAAADDAALIPASADVVRLTPGQDAISQISQALAARGQVASLHIVSHGADGRLVLGGQEIQRQDLLARADALKAWSQSLADDAAIELWGCDVAAGGEGESFVRSLARLTGKTVAASDDLTGPTAQGGDARLEFVAGRRSEVIQLFSAEDFAQTLAFSIAPSAGSTVHAVNGANATAIDPSLTVSAAGDTSTTALVKVATNYRTGEDVLNVSYAGITPVFTAANATLSLTSVSALDASQWQAVLRAVTFQTATTAPNLTARGVTFTIGSTTSAAKTVTPDLAVDTSMRTRLVEALDVVEAIGTKIGTFSGANAGLNNQTEVPYTGGLKVTDLLYPNSADLDSNGNPVHDWVRSIQPHQIGSYLALSQAAEDYLNAAPSTITDLSGLITALQARLATLLNDASATAQVTSTFTKPAASDARSLSLTIKIANTKGDDLALSLPDLERDLGLKLPNPPTIKVGGGADIEFTITLDLQGHTYGSALAQNKTTLAFNRLNALAGFTFSNVTTDAEFGMIGGQLVGASGVVGAKIPVTFSGATSRTLDNWATNGSNVTGFSSTLVGSANLDLPVTASIGGVLATTANSRIVVNDSNIFDSAAPSYTTTDVGQLLYFGTMKVEDVLQEILKLKQLYSTIDHSDDTLLGVDVPYLKDTTLGELLNFTDLFDAQIGSQVDIYEPVLNTPGRDALTDYRLPLSSDTTPVPSMWSDLRAGFQFGVIVNNTWPVVTVTVNANASRNTLNDLVSDVNAALSAANLHLQASHVAGKMSIKASDVSVQRFAVVPVMPPAARLTPTTAPSDLNSLTLDQAYYFNVTGSTSGTVKGTNYYTTDSSLAAAAVHAGLLGVGESGVIKVTRSSAVSSVWASSRNGVNSSAASGLSSALLIESGISDLRRLGLVDYSTPLSALDSFTDGRIRATFPLQANLDTNGQFVVTADGTTTTTVSVVDGNRASVADTLTDVQAGLAAAGIGDQLAARLVDEAGQVLSGAPESGHSYRLELYLPEGSTWTSFSLAPVSDAAAYRTVALGIMVGDVSALPRPSSLRTFDDFADSALFPHLAISPVYDPAAGTVTLQFSASGTTSPTVAANFDFNPDPVGRIKPSDASLAFTPSVTSNLAFGLQFKIGPDKPIKIASGATVPTDGRLTSDAHFSLDFVLQDKFAVTVPSSWTTANANVQDLVSDINRALKQTTASGGATVDLTTDRMVARRMQDGGQFELTTATPLNSGAAITLSHTSNVLNSDLVVPFTFKGQSYVLTVKRSDTTGNTSFADLVLDLNNALANVTIDANGNSVADSGETTESLADSVFFTTIADTAGGSDSNVYLFATAPGSTAWPQTITLSAARTDAAVTKFGFDDGGSGDTSSTTARGGGVATVIHNHTNNAPLAGGTVTLSLPSFAGSVAYGFNTLNFSGTSGGSLVATAGVSINGGLDLGSTAVSSAPASTLTRSIAGAGNAGLPAASLTLDGITAASGATISNNAAILVSIPDITDTDAIINVPVGVSIPVPGQTDGVITTTSSNSATVNFLYQGSKYAITVNKADTLANTSFADLAGQFNSALAHSTKTTAGVVSANFDASSQFVISADDDALMVAARTVTGNPEFATASFLPDRDAFGEVGLQGSFGPTTVASALTDVMPVLDRIQSGMDAFSNMPLPLIETTLNDLIDVKGDMLRRIESFRDMSVTTPDQIATALAAAFSVPTSYVDVIFDSANKAYRIDLKVETGVASEKVLDLTLADFYRFTNETPPQGLSRLVDTGSRVPLKVKIKATTVLSIGIDLSDAESPRTFLYGYNGSGNYGLGNGTSIQLEIQAAATGINFTAATGAFGVFVREGDATLGGPVVTSGGQPVYTFDNDTHELHFARQSDAATLTVTLGDDGSLFYLEPDSNNGEGDAFDLDNYSSELAGTAEVNLPLFTPTELINPFTNRTVSVRIQGVGLTDVHPGGNVMSLHVPDLQAYADHVLDATSIQNQISEIYSLANSNPNASQQSQIDGLQGDLTDLKDGGTVEIFTPDVEDANSGIQAPTLIDILRDPAILVDPLDILFGAIETGLRGLDNLNLPVIGPVLGDAVDNVFDWRQGWLLDLRNTMRGKGEEVFQSIKESIYDVLGPGGLDLLLKDNGIRSVDGMVEADSPDDVGLDFLDEAGDKMTGLGGYGADAVQFKLRLGQKLVDTGADLSFNFDSLAPAFTLGIDGGLNFKLGWDMTFGFGYDLEDGFYVVTDSSPTANELELRFEAGLRGASADYIVAADTNSPTGFAIQTQDGGDVFGPRKGDGTRDKLYAIPVDETGEPLDAADLNNVELPQEQCDDSNPAAAPGFEEQVFWVVAAKADDNTWVPAYLDKLGFYRAQKGASWTAVNDGDSGFNPDMMIQYNQTAPFNAFGSLFFLNLSATDMPHIGLGTLGDADYYYNPDEASTITAFGRNDPDAGVNRNNELPTRIAGRIGVNLKDPSEDAGGYVARPGLSVSHFVLMDGSNVIGGEPVLDENGAQIPVALNEDAGDVWYTLKPKDGIDNPTSLADYEFDHPITEDPTENRITWGELRQGGSGLFELKVNAEAVVNLAMELTVSDDANIPRLTADFNLDWRSDSMKPPSNPFDLSEEQERDLVPEVGVNNIRLDLGSFLTKLIKPVAVEVDKTLKPLDPLISAIQTQIPVLSDIAGRPIRLTTLLTTFGGPYGQAIGTFIDMAVLIRQLSGVMASVPDDANVYLPIGNFWLAKISNGPLGRPGLGKTIYYDNSEVDAPSITQRNQSLIANPGAALDATTNALGKVDALGEDGSSQPGVSEQDRGGFKIPMLEDPITIFKLLMGEDVPLVTFELPKLNVNFESDIPLVRIVCFEVGLRVGLQMRGQLAVGYDTKGIRLFSESGDPADLLEGFYVSDRANADGTGADVDEFWFRASIALYGGVDLYLVRAGIEGGFALTGSVNLNDPNNDGKLRAVEAVQLVQYTQNPLDLADLSLSGEVYARYYYWVGLKIWTPWKTYKITLTEGGKTFARLQLFSLSREGNDGPPAFAGVVTTVNPDGTDNPGTLLINAGPSAEKRVSNQDPLKVMDGAENFRVWNDSPGSRTIHVQYKNFSNSYTETYHDVSRVVFDGGAFDDTIDASGLNGIPVEFDGGAGNDTLKLGDAPTGSVSILKGGSGNDTIIAAGGNLRIEGGDGNDTITGGSGTNEIDGGDGNDTITGGGSGSTNKVFLRRSFGKDNLILDPTALVNLLDYVDSTLPLVGTLSGAGSTVYAGDTNVTTFSLGAVTEIRGSSGRDTFNFTNPTTRNANGGKGLILRGGDSVDTYNVVGNDLSGVASDGITIDDGIRPTTAATLGDIKLSDPCGQIKEIAVADGGASYSTAPDVVITDSTGAGARAVASLDKSGHVQGVYVLDGGEGYTNPVVALVDRVSYGDRLTFSSDTSNTVTLDKQGNGGSAYRLTSGSKSIKFVGWTDPGVPRGDDWNVSETDNVDINLPNGTLQLNDHLDLQETLTVNARRMQQNAAITADTVKITTERGFAVDHPIQATNNGDVSIRVSGKNIGDPADIATAEATVVDGAVTSIRVTNPGRNYDFAPVVAIVDDRGYAARGVATINSQGEVTGVTVLDGGFGYLSTPAPRVIISPPASIRLSSSISSSTVGSLPGSGDGRGQITLRSDLGSIVNAGEVFFPNGSNIEFKHGDFRYKSTDSLDDITSAKFPSTVGGLGAAATAVLDSDGRIERIDVVSGGSGYSRDLLPVVQIQGSATATAIVDAGGHITGFNITNPGEGYGQVPTVTILPNGFGKIVGADAAATERNRAALKSANGSLVATAYYGIGDPAKPIKTDVDRFVAQTLGDGAGVHVLEKDSLRIGTIDHVEGIKTVDGDVSVATFAGTIHLGQPVQAMNANGQLLWQDAKKTIPIYVRDENGKILYDGGQLQTGDGQIKLTADDVDINSFVGATGGQLIVQPTRFDAPIGLNGTQARATTAIGGGGQVSGTATLYSGRGYTTAPLVTIPPPGQRAYAVANVVAGAVQSVLVTFGGKGYNASYQPIVTFVGGGVNGATPAHPATATAVYDADGVVTGITVTSGGSGYVSAPQINITLPGVQATAVANVVDGKVSGITFTNPGANYAAPPEILIEAPYQFSLEAEEVQYLEDGFKEVVIGREDGAHTFQAVNATFSDAVRLRAPRAGGSMQVEGLRAMDAPVVMVGSGHTVNMNNTAPYIEGTTVEIDDNIVVHENTEAQITASTGYVNIFGVGKGKIDGVAGSTTENLTITDVGDVTVTGAIGSTNPIHNLTINSSNAGNIALQQSVTIEGDLHIVKGGNITFGGALSVGGNLIIDEGASVAFNGTVTVAGSVTISKATTVSFAQNVNVVGNFLLGNAAEPTKLLAVTFASTARLDVGGTVQIYADEDLSFGNRVGSTRTPTSVTLRSDTGSISFAAQVYVTGGNLTIQKADDVTFGHDLNAGVLAITAGGETRFNRAVNVGTLNVLSQELVVFSNQLNLSSGNATITADEVDFAGGSSTVKTVGAAINSAVLTIKPYTAGRNIGIGSPPAVIGVMDINDTDLAAIASGFAMVNIGDESNGGGTVTIGSIGTQQGGTISYLANNTSIHGGSISVVQPVDMALSSGTLRLHARTGDVTVNAALNGTALERGAVVRIEADAGNIAINAPVYATSEVQLIAAANISEGASGFVSTGGLRGQAGGSINLLHASNAVTTVAFSAANNALNFREDSGYAIGTVNGQSGIAAGTGDVTLTTIGGTVTQTQAVTASGLSLQGAGGIWTLTNAANDIAVLTANTRKVTYVDANTYTVGTVGSSSGITATDDVTLNGAGTLTLNAPITTVGAGNVSLTSTGAAISIGAAGDINSAGTISLGAVTGIASTGDLIAAGAITLNATSGPISTGAPVRATAGSITYTASGAITISDVVRTITSGNISITSLADMVNVGAGGDLFAAGSIAVAGYAGVDSDGDMTSATTTSVTSANGAIDCSGVTTTTNGAVTHTAHTSLVLSGPTTAGGANGNVALTSDTASITLTAAADIAAAKAITINSVSSVQSDADLSTAAGAISVAASAGTLTSNGVVHATAGQASFTATGDIALNGPVTTTTSGNISVTSSAGAVTVAAAADFSSAGTITISGYQTSTLNGDLIAAGSISADDVNGGLTVAGATQTTNGAVGLSAQDGVDVTGAISAGGSSGNVSLASRGFYVYVGNTITAAGTITATAADDINNASNWTAGGAILATATNGGVSTGGTVTSTTSSITFTGQSINNDGPLNAATSISLTAGDWIDNSATLTSGTTTTISAANSVVTSAAINSGGNVGITAPIIAASTSIITTSDNVALNGAVTLPADLTVDTGSGLGDVTFSSTINGPGKLTLKAGTGNISVAGTIGAVTRLAALDVQSATQARFAGNVSTTGAQTLTATTVVTNGTHDVSTASAKIDVTGLLSLESNSRLSTNGGTIDLDAVSGNSHNLTLASKSGTITVSGDATGLATLALQDDVAASTGAVFFQANFAAQALTTVGRAYSVSLTGSSTVVTNLVTLLNTGSVTLGKSATDAIHFVNGVIASGSATNPSVVHLGGTLTTDAALVRLGVTQLDTDAAVDTTFGGAGGAVTFAGTLDGTHNLRLNSGPARIDFDAAVGNTNALGTVTIDRHGGLTADSSFSAASLTQSAATGLTTFSGNVMTSAAGGISLHGTDVAFASTVTTTGSGGISVVMTGDAHFGGAVLSAADLIVRGDDVDFDSTVSTSGSTGVDIASTTLDMDAAVTISGSGMLDVAVTGLANFDGSIGVANAGIVIVASDVHFHGAVSTATDVSISHTGTLDIAAAADFNLSGEFKQIGTGSVTTAGDITTTGDRVSFAGAVSLTGPVVIATANGAVDFLSTLDGGSALSINAGLGDVHFAGAVGQVVRLGAVTVTSAHDVTLSAAFAAVTLTQVAGSGTTSVRGLLDTTAAGGVAIRTNTIEVTATGAIATHDGTVVLNADTGALTVFDGAFVDAGTGTIDIDSVGDATVTGLLTGNNTPTAIAVTSSAGAIVDAGNTRVDITAAAPLSVVTLRAASGIGMNNPLETRIAVLDAAVTGISGDIRLAEQADIRLASVHTPSGTIDISAGSIVAQDVQTNDGDIALLASLADVEVGLIRGTGRTTIRAAQGAVVDTGASSNDGVTSSQVEIVGRDGIGTNLAPISVRADRYQAAVSDGGSSTAGNIFLATTNLTAVATIADLLTTGTGSIHVSHTGSDLQVVQAATESGPISISVAAGSLTAGDLSTINGDISLTTVSAGRSVLLGSVRADGFAVTVASAGDILESGSDVGIDVLGNDVTFESAGAIGTDANPIEINADILSAHANGTGGGIYLAESNDVAVDRLVASGVIRIATPGTILLNSSTAIRSDEHFGSADAAQPRTIDFLGKVQLLRDTTIQSGSTTGNVHFGDTVGGGYALSINAGAGDLTFDGHVATPARMNVVSAGAVWFRSGLELGLGGLAITAGTRVVFDGATTVGGDVSLVVNNTSHTGNVLVNGNFSTTHGGDLVVDHDGVAHFADGIVFNIAGDTRFVGSGKVEFGSLTYNTGGDIVFDDGPLVLTSNTIIDTGTSGGDVTFRDDVSGNFTLTIRGTGGDVTFENAAGTNAAPLAALVIDGVSNVHFQQAVVTSGDASLAATGNVTFDQSVTTGGLLDVHAGGAVVFSDALGSGNGLAVDAGGSLTFAKPVAVLHGVTDLSHAGPMTVASGANFTLGGEFHEHGAGPVVLNAVQFVANDDMSFDGDVSLNDAVSFDTTGGSGDVAFNGAVNGRQTLTIRTGNGSVVFAGPVGSSDALGAVDVIGGAITIGADFKTAVGEPVSFVGSGNLTIGDQADVSIGGDASLTTSATFVMESGATLTVRDGSDLILTAEDAELAGGAHSIQGSGLLVIQPFSDDRAITLGTAGGNQVGANRVGGPRVGGPVVAGSSGSLNLSTAELNTFGGSFTTILVGRGTQGGFDSSSAGSHEITINDATFASDLVVRTAGIGGTITVAGTLRLKDGSDAALYSGEDTKIDGLLRTDGAGTVLIVADAEANGVGAVRVAGSGDATIRTESGDVTMIGESVRIGSDTGAGSVTSQSGSVVLRTNYIAGQIFVFNDRSVLSAGTDVVLGNPDDQAHSPSFIRVEGTLLSGRHVRGHSRGPIELSDFRIRSRGMTQILADGDLRMENGTAVAQGGPVALVADANGDGSGTTTETDVRRSDISDTKLRLQVTGLKVKGVLSAGDSGKAYVTVFNDGATTLSTTVKVMLYASSDAELDASDVVIGRLAKALTLKPGASKRLAMPVAIPADMPSGTFQVIGEALPYRSGRDASAAPSTAEDPNISVPGLTFRVQKPDLVSSVKSSFDGGATASGRNGKVYVTVANHGEVPSVGTATLVLYATRDGTFDTAVEVARQIIAANFKPGKGKTFKLNVTLPPLTGGSQWRWLSVVNPEGAVAEESLDNNFGLSVQSFRTAA